jgi:hypothetical protein
MKIATLSAIALLLAANAAYAGPLNPAHLPSDAKWVGHVDFEQMRASKLAAACRKEMEKHEKFHSRIKEATDKLGMNPMKDLLGATMYDTGYKHHQGVVLIHCAKLDREKLVALFKKKHPDHTTSKYGDWTFYTWTAKHKRHGEHPVTGTFANDNTIALASDAGKLKKALDVISGKGESLGSDAKLLAGLGKKSIFAARAIDVDTEYMKKTRCPVLRNCEEATVVWREKDGELVGQYALVTDSEDTAKSFKAVVEGFKAIVSLKFSGDELAAKLTSGLNARAKGTAFNVTYKADSDDIIAAAHKMKEMRKKWGGRHGYGHPKDEEKKKEEI